MARLDVIFLCIFVSCLSLVAPVSGSNEARETVQKDYSWDVTDWSAGCARSGCYYSFNICGSQDQFYPQFTAQCSAYESQGYTFIPCNVSGQRNVQVSSRFLKREVESEGPKRFAVSIQFDGSADQPGSYFNATGYETVVYNQFVAPERNFTITPTEIWGVA